MRLSKQAVTSFQDIYKDKCDISLNYEEAHNLAVEELQKFALIYQPIPKEDRNYLKQFNSNK